MSKSEVWILVLALLAVIAAWVKVWMVMAEQARERAKETEILKTPETIRIVISDHPGRKTLASRKRRNHGSSHSSNHRAK